MKKRKVVVEIYRLSADKKKRDVLLTLENLSVRFKITQYRGTVFSQGTISVCGLSQEHINQLTTFQGAYLATQNDKYIRLTAGYVDGKEDNSAVIFDGLIFKAIPTMPPDIWLNMEVFSNLNLVSEEKEISVENTTAKDLVKKIASVFDVSAVLDYSTSNATIDKFYFKGNLPALERKLYEMFKNDKIFYYEQGKIIVDDWAKIRHQANGGLTSGQKFLLQLAAAAVFVAALRLTGYLTPNLFIPFIGVTIPLPWIVFMLLAIFIIVGCDNAVNLTDGIDGLAASVTVPVAIFFIVIGYKTGNLPVVIYASALLGGLLGFLVFNFNPARVFMGDTGSLFLGGAVCGLALACDMPLILIFVGLIYIIETLSVIIQTSYFKMSGGKRIFKMAPIHHHFEMCGWGEKKIVFVFTAITAVMCVVAYFGAMPRF